MPFETHVLEEPSILVVCGCGKKRPCFPTRQLFLIFGGCTFQQIVCTQHSTRQILHLLITPAHTKKASDVERRGLCLSPKIQHVIKSLSFTLAGKLKYYCTTTTTPATPLFFLITTSRHHKSQNKNEVAPGIRGFSVRTRLDGMLHCCFELNS